MESSKESMKTKFYIKLKELNESKNYNSINLTQEKYDRIIHELKLFESTVPKPQKYFTLRKRYQLITVDCHDKLIRPTKTDQTNIIYHVPEEDIFDILYSGHVNTGHGGRTRMHEDIKKKFYSITLAHINLFNQLCIICEQKKKNNKRGIVVKPMVFEDYLLRAQVDLIDLQSCPDGEYRFIRNYQEHLSKFCILRPLKRKTAEAVANELVDIFSIFGAPVILKSDNGKEFDNRLLLETLTSLWPGLKIVHGKPRHSQSQGSVERANQDVENMLMAACKEKNHSNWAKELKFVQYRKNASYHEALKQSPYSALFGCEPKFGLQTTSIPTELIESLQEEEQVMSIYTSSHSGQQSTCTSSQRIESQSQSQVSSGIQCESNITSTNQCGSEISSPNQWESESNVESECEDIFAKIDEDCTREIFSQRSSSIKNNRKRAIDGLKQQARKMLKTSENKLTDVKVGDTVRISLPSVDKGRIDSANILARVQELNQEHGTGKSL